MRIDLNIPKSWEELTDKQLLFVSKLYLEALPKAEFLSLCLMEFCGLTLIKKPLQGEDFLFTKEKDQFVIDADMWVSLCHQLNWTLNTVGEIKNPAKIGRSYGCHQRLYSVTLEQMLLADNYYSVYNQTKDLTLLAQFTAVFYRRWWQKFKSGKTKKRSAYYLNYVAEMNVVLIWYTGVRMSLRRRFPSLYHNTGTDEAQSPEETVLNILSALNGGDITKNPKLYKSPCIEALKQLNNLAERAEKLKK